MDSILAPIFHYMEEVISLKGFISNCYSMLLDVFLTGFPLKTTAKWEKDVGALESEQWGEVLQAVLMSSLNVAQGLSQLYIIQRVHYTPAKLARMGVRLDSDCPRCAREHGLDPYAVALPPATTYAGQGS